MTKMFVFDKSAETRRNLHTHTHTHTCNFLIAIFLSVFSIFSVYSVPSFATNVDSGEDATCDEDTLESPTGPVRLRAEYQPETINLNWYDENNNRITVPTNSNTCTYDTSISLPPNPTKTGYKFKGWKVMPEKPIAYLQSTGTQWIDTGISGYPIGLSVEPKVEFTEFGVERAICGLYGSCGTFELGNNSNGSLFLFNAAGYGTGTGNLHLNLNTVYNITGSMTDSNISLIVNGTNYNSGNAPTAMNSSNLVLFNHCIYDGDYPAKLKMYYFKIYRDGTLVRDFVPAKDDNGVTCMYDKISNQYFYNRGSGDFIPGPDI